MQFYTLDRLEKNLVSSSGTSTTVRWRILCEEVSTAGAVSALEAEKALQLLLDSERVYEDLEYALRGPSGKKGAVAVLANTESDSNQGSNMSLISAVITQRCATLHLLEHLHRYQRCD